MTDPYMDVLDELRDLTLRKRKGYSPGDDPFANFRLTKMFKVPCECGCGHATPIPPIFGIYIREMDKISRIASLLANPDNDQVGESIRDTGMDAGNYPLIGVALLDADKAAAERKFEAALPPLLREASLRMQEQAAKAIDARVAAELAAQSVFDDAGPDEGPTEFQEDVCCSPTCIACGEVCNMCAETCACRR